MGWLSGPRELSTKPNKDSSVWIWVLVDTDFYESCGYVLVDTDFHEHCGYVLEKSRYVIIADICSYERCVLMNVVDYVLEKYWYVLEKF
ncbi:hypothetical protein CEXT_435631 [Caerostris extrusa]|uniref:Uncharacterized protein n=1 Tax=Caerostris extrusa TaxID=172846 RepID=A0AAV4P459_CAEEX|nr:hypothetical protein CEXT_435631 [Caerostris extrusa]